MLSSQKLRVLVAGAGIVGSSVAYYLARRGVSVHLIDRTDNPSATTRASLGVLTHFKFGDDDYSRFHRDGHALHTELAAQMHEETGMDVGWRPLGGFDLAFGEEAMAAAFAWLEVNADSCACEWVDGSQLRVDEPCILPQISGGIYYPDDHRVDPSALTLALRSAALHRGAKLQTGAELLELDSGADGVEADIGTAGNRKSQRFDHVVITTGSWSGYVASFAGRDPGIRPVRGQHRRYRGGTEIHHVLRWDSYHAIPSWDEIIVGATVEDVGYDLSITESAACRFDHAFKQVLDFKPVPVSQWSGLRPKPRKGRPVIGPLDENGRVFVASGHYKNGVLLGPLTGNVVAHWLTEGNPPRDMARFAVDR